MHQSTDVAAGESDIERFDEIVLSESCTPCCWGIVPGLFRQFVEDSGELLELLVAEFGGTSGTGIIVERGVEAALFEAIEPVVDRLAIPPVLRFDITGRETFQIFAGGGETLDRLRIGLVRELLADLILRQVGKSWFPPWPYQCPLRYCVKTSGLEYTRTTETGSASYSPCRWTNHPPLPSHTSILDYIVSNPSYPDALPLFNTGRYSGSEGRTTMSGTITVMSWNVQGEFATGQTRFDRQMAFLDEVVFDGDGLDVDVFLLQAVNYEKDHRSTWGGQLGEFITYFSTEKDYYYEHTADWAHELLHSDVQPYAGITNPFERCSLTISRWPLERRPLTLRNSGDRKPVKLNYYYTHFPGRLLVSEVDLSENENMSADELEVWNAAVPAGSNWGEEKVKALETIYARIHLQNEKIGDPLILGGDFNAPKKEEPNRESTTDRIITPHGEGANQYDQYPFYGDPYYFRKSAIASDEAENHEKKTELLFEQRWKMAESNLFDPEIGDWNMKDVYWVGKDRPKSSTEDYTHKGTKKRLDHILLSNHFSVDNCDVLDEEETEINGVGTSDHLPVYADVELEE